MVAIKKGFLLYLSSFGQHSSCGFNINGIISKSALHPYQVITFFSCSDKTIDYSYCMSWLNIYITYTLIVSR